MAEGEAVKAARASRRRTQTISSATKSPGCYPGQHGQTAERGYNMAKVQTTRKALMAAYAPYYRVCLGYCELQEYIRFLTPAYYTSGQYGWNCDGYIIGDYLLTTGYRGMLGEYLDAKEIEKAKPELERIVKRYKENLITYTECKKLIEDIIYCLCYNTIQQIIKAEIAKRKAI